MAADFVTEPVLELVHSQTEEEAVRAVLASRLKLTGEEVATMTLLELAERASKRIQHLETRIAWSAPCYGTEI